MSDLTSIEKLKLEKLLGMSTGYVLDFSNRTFQEFILENMGIDIYASKYDYQSGSKANRLRAFWKKESNAVVGELTEYLLEYWKAQKLLDDKIFTHQEQQLLEECNKIVKRLRGGKVNNQKTAPHSKYNKAELLTQFDKLASLTSAEDRKQRGYLLEKLLQDVFPLYDIPVEKGFRRNKGGEQIDGAFKLDGWYYLVECKWTQKLTDIRQIDSLYTKINRSGKQTLGLFLSMNGWSDNVCPLLKQNPEKSIILMDGYDLRCVLAEQPYVNLEELLLAKLAHLNFEGEPFFSVIEYMKKVQKTEIT